MDYTRFQAVAFDIEDLWKKEINCYGEIRSIPKMWIFLPQWHIFTSSLLIVSFCSRWYERSWPFSAWEHENYTFVFTINVIIDERYCLDVDDFIRRDEWNSCWTKFELSKIFFPKKEKKTKIKYTLEIRSSISSEKKLSNFSKLIEPQSSRVKGLN